jgi:hypothetical protein
MYSLNAIIFPVYLLWRRDYHDKYVEIDMDALILSAEPMSLEQITFGYYYKMNPSRVWGIYYDFIIQAV